MKKIFYGLLISSLMITAGVGCGSDGASSSSTPPSDPGLTRTNTPAKIRIEIPKSLKKSKSGGNPSMMEPPTGYSMAYGQSNIEKVSKDMNGPVFYQAPAVSQGYSNIANALLDMEVNTTNMELNMLLVDQAWDKIIAKLDPNGVGNVTGDANFANGELKITFTQQMYDFLAKAFEDVGEDELIMFKNMIGQEVPLGEMKFTVNSDSSIFKYRIEFTEDGGGKSFYMWNKEKTRIYSYSSWSENEDTDYDGTEDTKKSYVNTFESKFPTDGSAYEMKSGYQQTNLTLKTDGSGDINTGVAPEKFSTFVLLKQDMDNKAKDGVHAFVILKDKTSFDDGTGNIVNIDMEVNSWGKADDDGGFLESYIVDIGQDVKLQTREFFDSNGALTGYYQLLHKPAGWYNGVYELASSTWEPAEGLTVTSETSVYFDADIKNKTNDTIEAVLSGNATERDYATSLTDAASGKTVEMYAIIPNGVTSPTEGDIIGSVVKEESSGSWNVSFRGTTDQLTARPNVYLVHYAPNGSKNFTQVANVSVRKPDDRDEYNEVVFDAGSYFQEMFATRDSNGKFHVVYESRSDWKLYYATNKSGSWVKEKITTAGGYHFSQGIAIDSNGKIHIVYNIVNSSNFSTHYITNASGSWVTTEIAASAQYRADIAVVGDGSAGKVHIAYIDGSKNLQYADSSDWNSKTEIDNGGNVTSVKLGFDNSKVHVAYTNGTNLIYANSDAWGTKDTVGAIGNKYVSDLIFNSSNKVYIALIHDDDVYIANNSSGSWAHEKVDEYYRHYPTIAFDSAGKLHMACAFAGPGQPFWLRYATNKSGTWKTREIHQDRVKGAGNSSFIFIDGSGKIEIIHQAWVGNTIDKFNM